MKIKQAAKLILLMFLLATGIETMACDGTEDKPKIVKVETPIAI